MQSDDQIMHFDMAGAKERPVYCPFDDTTRSFVYGLQPRAIQGMLDFDYSCEHQEPSIAAMIYPFSGHHIQKLYDQGGFATRVYVCWGSCQDAS